jgi:hypothetical protein
MKKMRVIDLQRVEGNSLTALLQIRQLQRGFTIATTRDGEAYPGVACSKLS